MVDRVWIGFLAATALLLSACEGTDRGDAASSDAGSDAAIEDARPADGGGSIVNAAPNERCRADELIGLVELADEGGQLWTSARLDVVAAPWIGAPALMDSSCAFHVGPDESRCACQPGEACSVGGTCVPLPAPAENIRLVVRSGDDEQSFSPASPGVAYGMVTLPGRSFVLELHGLGHVFAASETEVPPMLSGLQGTLMGTHEAPIAVDLRWDRPAGPSNVFTHIPINHHVAGPTFTECDVDAQTAALHVDRAMLEPLAVGTGLEFQDVQHVRFSAATIAGGCVEFRVFTRHYVNLF